ncbi:unnamed protein product [Camellia sinensis]
MIEGQSSQSFTCSILPLHKGQHILKITPIWCLHCLQVRREVVVLHGEVHGSLEALIPGVHDLTRKTIQSFLHVQIVIGIEEIIITKAVSAEAFGVTVGQAVVISSDGDEGVVLRRDEKVVWRVWAQGRFTRRRRAEVGGGGCSDWREGRGGLTIGGGDDGGSMSPLMNDSAVLV